MMIELIVTMCMRVALGACQDYEIYRGVKFETMAACENRKQELYRPDVIFGNGAILLHATCVKAKEKK